ncbi:hypothetical protein GGH12_006011 [Coemansia sp. RSA 1822]|nr:hypothetical protein LPJ76_005492 [Coemansia sp. RSA 638]KAJ2119232.1 hypothetical protein IW147_006034 [Coemansia sp. RSA 720]KAJ2542623.1 hypothetical protein GGF49_002711 [Coemansia sp. RSA 1853]KAJ2558055.1 hypothetical protein GGH12_006011 [Coemansia sp. RSA 1822]
MYSLNNVKGGILVKDGKRTSCELGVIDSQSSLVSAACLDFTSGKVSEDTQYEVYLDDGLDGKAAKHAVESITVHPAYDSANHTNDVVVVQYNSGSKIEWQNIILPDFSYVFDKVVYVRRSLLDMDSMQWDTPKYMESSMGYNERCMELSVIYSYNQNTVAYGNYSLTTPSVDLTACRVPYGILYGLLNNQTHLIGVFSYAAIAVYENLCNKVDYCSYYAMYAKFAPYIESVLGRSINLNLNYFGEGVIQTNASFSFGYKPIEDIRSTGFIVGDLYKNQSDSITFIPSDSSQDTLDTDNSDASSSDADGGTAEKSRSSRNLTGIIVGVCVSVAGLLIIGIVAFVCIRRRRERAVDPMGQQEIQNALEADIGGATAPGNMRRISIDSIQRADIDDSPPVYESAESSHTVSVAAKGEKA